MPLPLFMPAIAEIFLAAAALLVVVFGVFSKSSDVNRWSRTGGIALIGAMILAIKKFDGPITTFGNMFIQDNLSLTFKGIIATGSLLAIALSVPYFNRRNDNKFEYPLLILLATVGMFGMVSANDFLSLYVSLELQSLSLYILASFHRDERLSAEAGLKYFFLGALSSGILLYGISLLYGYTGSTSYLTLANTFAAQDTINPAAIIGLVMILAGIGFKISAAPFHMWAPDVYQGAPTPVTALFAMAPKAAAIGIMCRLVMGPFYPVFDQAQQVLIALSILSMAVGSFAAIAQVNIKRLMAYSSIGHVGFILMALSAGDTAGIRTAIFYTITYIVMSVGAFAVILSVYDGKEGDEKIVYLSGLAKRQPILAASFAVILLSMAGIPPMVGFFSKLYVFAAAWKAELQWLVIAGVLFSVVSAYYYLRLIKTMYFDAAPEDTPAIVLPWTWFNLAVLSALLCVIMLVFPEPISHLATWASMPK